MLSIANGGHKLDIYEHERAGHGEKKGLQEKLRGAAIHCLDVPEALAECRLTGTIWSSLHGLGMSSLEDLDQPGCMRTTRYPPFYLPLLTAA